VFRQILGFRYLKHENIHFKQACSGLPHTEVTMSEGSAKGARVLIVDDTIQNIQVLGTVLREENYQINVAQNGLQALDVVTKVTPDIILLDVMMPELDGFGTCERLKADPATRDIPIIFLTAKVETEDIVHGFELGAVDYVTKPFNATELLARVHTHLEIQRLQRELQEYNDKLEQKVEERTAEVVAAHAQLQRQVKELEGRDRLSNAQMSAGSADEAYEEILLVVAEVLDVPQVLLLRPEEGGALAPVAAIREGTILRSDDLTDSTVDEASRQTYADARPRQEGAAASVPVLYGEEIIGVISVDGLTGDDEARKQMVEVLWRLAREAALVCHNVELNTDLESGEFDISALLDMNTDD
jgi:DNA-binding response OmpR family regulator